MHKDAAAPRLGAGSLLDTGTLDWMLWPRVYTDPDVADWNNDGRKDLLTGSFWFGYVWLHLNDGTDASPHFSSGTRVKDGLTPITTSYT